MDNLKKFLTEIQQRGLEIKTVYDIGAWTGGWSRDIKSSVLQSAEFILFEGSPQRASELAGTGFTYFGTVLSSPEKDYVDYYSTTGTGDSYYKENTENYDNVPPLRLPCTTLDIIVKKYGLTMPNFIKIDTQGSELDVLSGSESVLPNTDIIYTECPIVPYNIGSPNIQDYLDFFKERNFIPIDLLETHTFENTLVQVDIMFMRKPVKEQIFGQNKFIRL
jgi:FkbM family methyltransferase